MMEKYLGTSCSAVPAKHRCPAPPSSLGKVSISRCNPVAKSWCGKVLCCASKPFVGARRWHLCIPGDASRVYLPGCLTRLKGMLLFSVKYWGSTEEYFPSARGKKVSVSSSQATQTEGSDPRCQLSTGADFSPQYPGSDMNNPRCWSCPSPHVCWVRDSTGRA